MDEQLQRRRAAWTIALPMRPAPSTIRPVPPLARLLRRMAVLGALVVAALTVAGAHAAGSAPSGGGTLSLGVAVLLGAVQGATEFLPVSSSGHLALAQAWLDVDPEVAGHRFSIVLHAGTLAAVVWLYRTDVWGLLGVLRRPLADSSDRRMLIAMFVASLPLGLVLVPGVEDFIIAVEQSPRYVGIALLATAVILLLAFRNSQPVPDTPNPEPPALPRAVGIGLAQLFAVLPGISRSGSTIAAGLGFGLDREQAARFSFLISLPAIGGATAREVMKMVSAPEGGAVPWLAYGAGLVTSFGIGLLCLRLLLALVRSGKIMGFVIYLGLLGAAAIAIG